MTGVGDLLEPLTRGAHQPPSLEELSRRVESRRRRRRIRARLGVLACVALLAGGVTLARRHGTADTIVTVGPNSAGVRSSLRLPSGPGQASSLLPAPEPFGSVLPGMHIRLAHDGKTWGDNSPVAGAQFAVTRQWVSSPGVLRLQPGQPFPDEIFTVVAAVARFPTVNQARSWIAGLHEPGSVAHSVVGGSGLPTDLALYEVPGNATATRPPSYIGLFTAGPLAFSLQMTASTTPLHQSKHLSLVLYWLGQLPSTISGQGQSGTAAGRLELVGGTVPGRTRFVAGTVTGHPADGQTLAAVKKLNGTGTVTTPASSDGVFRMSLPVGIYTITGRSPSFHGGTADCTRSGTIRIQKDRNTQLTVSCPVR